MNDIISRKIKDMIYEIRGKQVMLASDVARLYNVETKRVNEVVKRNLSRFPKSFCFQLTSEEIEKLSLRSQIATLNKSGNLRGKHYKYLPYVFTEVGVAMISTILKTKVATKISMAIMDVFVELRKYINDYYLRIPNIETKVISKNIREN